MFSQFSPSKNVEEEGNECVSPNACLTSVTSVTSVPDANRTGDQGSDFNDFEDPPDTSDVIRNEET